MFFFTAVLAVVAWGMPILFWCRPGRRNPLLCFVGSLIACCGELFLSLVRTSQLVSVGDWAAIGDTAGVTLFLSGLLFVGTLVLNFIVCLRVFAFSNDRSV